MMGRCAACNGGPEHHTGLKNTPNGWGDCLYWWVYRDREGLPFRLVRF